MIIYPRKVYWWVVVSGEWVGGRPNLRLAKVQVFGPLVLGPFRPDLDLTWDLDLDQSLTISSYLALLYEIQALKVWTQVILSLLYLLHEYQSIVP